MCKPDLVYATADQTVISVILSSFYVIHNKCITSATAFIVYSSFSTITLTGYGPR